METFKILSNFRDIGGVIGKDGRSVKKGLLFRCGQLYDLPKSEVNALENDFYLKTIVDLRSQEEIDKFPNVQVKGTKTIHINLMDDDNQTPSMEHFLEDISEAEIDQYFMQVYEKLVMKVETQVKLKEFIKTLAENHQQPLLWHCYAGKDRTGITAALILYLLGVSKEDIMKDYLQTNQLRQRENQRILEELKTQGLKDHQIKSVEQLLLVKPQYLQHSYNIILSRFGTVDDYIYKALKIDSSMIAKLQDYYLE